ncbi:MAG: fructosamine kinase family protein [Planctomycetota bacterium]
MDEVARFLSKVLDEPQLQILHRHSIGGGCIAQAMRLELSNGESCFAKFLDSSSGQNVFEIEAEGLRALADTKALRVPRVLGHTQLASGQRALLLEWIGQKSVGQLDFGKFGSQLAQMHLKDAEPSYGWHQDNFLGSNPQSNTISTNWLDFFAQQRLGFQLSLARQHALGTSELYRCVDRLCERLDRILGKETPHASLLHGDLWSGNFLADSKGNAVLIDPAVYRGHREAELAMPLIFGGFPQQFFDSYNESWPLDAGWRERVEIYKLYHYLNHLNLFGSTYLSNCLTIARRFGS